MNDPNKRILNENYEIKHIIKIIGANVKTNSPALIYGTCEMFFLFQIDRKGMRRRNHFFLNRCRKEILFHCLTKSALAIFQN